MEPTNQAVLEFFNALGFAEVPIEEGLTGLSFEDGPDGEYALITNEDGLLPTSLETALLVAFYTTKGAFLWSTGFKNAAQFQGIWLPGTSYAEKMQNTQHHRDQMIAASPLANLLGGGK